MTQPTSSEAVEAAETNAETPEAVEAPDVEQLQQQAAEAAEKLAEATTRGDQYFEVLRLRTMEAAAGDLLQAVDHMPEHDDRYYDNAGFPSLEGMREVAQELVASRPYLAKAAGSVHQGVKGAETVPTWSEILQGVLN